MEAMREKWTDERLDDLNGRVSDGFNRLDAEVRELRGEMGQRFDAMQRLILQVGAGMFATLAIGFVSLLLAQH